MSDPLLTQEGGGYRKNLKQRKPSKPLFARNALKNRKRALVARFLGGFLQEMMSEDPPARQQESFQQEQRQRQQQQQQELQEQHQQTAGKKAVMKKKAAMKKKALMKKKGAPKKGSLRGGQSGDPDDPPVTENFEQSAMQKLLSVASSQLSGGAKINRIFNERFPFELVKVSFYFFY
jgi:hypothetical protein